MDHADELNLLNYDPQRHQYHYLQRTSWPVSSADMMASQPNMGMSYQHPVQRSTLPTTLPNAIQSDGQPFYHTHEQQQQQQQQQNQQQLSMDLRNWVTPHGLPMSTTPYVDTGDFPREYETYNNTPFDLSPTDYSNSTNAQLNATGLETNLDANLPLEYASYIPNMPLQTAMATSISSYGWENMENMDGFMEMSLPNMADSNPPRPDFVAATSPSDGTFDVRSLPSSCSDNGMVLLDYPSQQSLVHNHFHPRTGSDSSSDHGHHHHDSWDTSSYVRISHPAHSMSSPGTDSGPESENFSSDYSHRRYELTASPPAAIIKTTAVVPPIAIRPNTTLPRGSTSPIVRKTPARKMSAKSTKAVARRPSQAVRPETTEKKVGKRKGPLKSDQRKQAAEIRKLGACLRCRFLKKTCDPGEPCTGCKPAHARLWIVPCTRIDIKDLGYFLKDWTADYQRHITLGLTIGNVKGFSDEETTLYITHGYGHIMPIQAREVYVVDERCFGVDWVEDKDLAGGKLDSPKERTVDTARLSAGQEGISPKLLNDYLDLHIDRGFLQFVDEYYQGTPFTTEILRTAYTFWYRERTPVIRKALKLVIAYNLTQHCTIVQPIAGQKFQGEVTDPDSKWRGQIFAPVMINFQIKMAMADMWRELQKDLLEELSTLYSSVYTKDKLKHWPTIFILASILLTIWETMQFDCRYKVPDSAAVEKFCNDMETTPVGVVVGLFQAISQKLPAFGEWDSRKHQQMLGNNPNVSAAMDEVREHVNKFDPYLRQRPQAKFDRNDFDCLANVFVSKLVIRAN